MAEAEFNDELATRLQHALEERDALKRALDACREQETLLTHDFHHHIRNQLAVVRSIFSRSIETARTLEQAVEHFPGRLNAAARYQAHFSSPDVGIDLEMLIADELIAVASVNDPRIEIGGPEVRLRHDRATAMALAMHELLINSVKFGVLGTTGERGNLRVTWRLVDRQMQLEWLETGVSVVASAPLASGFGRHYIEQALPYQLGAKTTFDFAPGTVRCQISLSVE